MTSVLCPSCRGAAVIVGHGSSRCFNPQVGRTPDVNPGVVLQAPLSACLSCGHVWSTLDPARLRRFIESAGNELARQQLDEFDRGPCRDLPDTEIGRAIGAKVAAVDAEARAGANGAVRKYREVSGVTWDEALRVAGDWPRLTREEKLALFGWAPKRKTKKALDDFDSPFI